MATNTLTAAAAEVDSRVEPATKFFDPSASLGIMQRYGMSGQSRAFAEDALKSANEIDKAANYDPQNRRNDLEKHEWQRTVQGRADVEYGRKKEQEDAFGAWAKEAYSLDIDNDPTAEEKLGALASNPLLADYEPVRAILNHRFGELEGRRREKVIQAEKENSLEWRVAEIGLKPTDLLGDDGRLDPNKGAEAFRKIAEAQAGNKAAEKFRTEQTNVVGKERVHYLDMDYAQLDAEITSGVKGLAESAKAQGIAMKVADAESARKLLASDPAMPKEAFVAQVLDLDKSLNIPDNLDPTARIIALSKATAELPASLRHLVSTAEGVWAAHHLKRFKKPADPADPKAADKPVDTDAQKYKDAHTPAK